MNKFAGKDEFDYRIVAKVVQGIAAKAQQPSAAVPLSPGYYLCFCSLQNPVEQATRQQEYCTDDEVDWCGILDRQNHILFPMSA
nr:hypothetical protein LTR18_008620 [Exophiala xenobiotica]